MQSAIYKIGGNLYQYRPCRMDASFIYDIENIRNNVAYARTPLKMNDPFDSKIGFSVETIYAECIDFILAALEVKGIKKEVLSYILKYRLLGKFSDLISELNKLRKYLLTKQKIMHKEYEPIKDFVAHNLKKLYSHYDNSLGLFNNSNFPIFCMIAIDINEEINENTLLLFLQVNDGLDKLEEKIQEVQKNYISFLDELLSTMTISCFTSSGWDNPIMWSHYANVYSGFCIEYDFSNVKKYLGIIGQIKYSHNRPTLALKDLGITGISFLSDHKDKDICSFTNNEINIEKIIEYFLVKDNCWAQEKEWRIINTGQEPYQPTFIEMPPIKSITIGSNMGYLCRQYLFDVCNEKDIPCYCLELNASDYIIRRKQFTQEDCKYDIDQDIEYCTKLLGYLSQNAQNTTLQLENFNAIAQKGTFDHLLLQQINDNLIRNLTDIYFLANSLTRISSQIDLSNNTVVSEQLTFLIATLDKFLPTIASFILHQNGFLKSSSATQFKLFPNFIILSQQCDQLNSLITKTEPSLVNIKKYLH